jgi:hypothetical protein
MRFRDARDRNIAAWTGETGDAGRAPELSEELLARPSPRARARNTAHDRRRSQRYGGFWTAFVAGRAARRQRHTTPAGGTNNG